MNSRVSIFIIVGLFFLAAISCLLSSLREPLNKKITNTVWVTNYVTEIRAVEQDAVVRITAVNADTNGIVITFAQPHDKWSTRSLTLFIANGANQSR